MSAPVIDRPDTRPGEDNSPFDWAKVESEFSKTCMIQDPTQCDNPATWIASSKHGILSCPSAEIYLCEEHMKAALEWWKNALTLDPAPTCHRCNVQVSGLVKDFLFAIRL